MLISPSVLLGWINFVAEMPPKRGKSPARPSQYVRPDMCCFGEGAVEFGGHASTLHPPSHRVHFIPRVHSRKCASECGDCPRINLRTLLKAIKSMEERLEGKIDIITPRLLKTDWSAQLNEDDFQMVSEDQETT